jgi:hypothetical protein
MASIYKFQVKTDCLRRIMAFSEMRAHEGAAAAQLRCSQFDLTPEQRLYRKSLSWALSRQRFKSHSICMRKDEGYISSIERRTGGSQARALGIAPCTEQHVLNLPHRPSREHSNNMWLFRRGKFEAAPELSRVVQTCEMASTSEDAELAPSTAPGYKITEKKTVQEYAALDAKYESPTAATDGSLVTSR